MATKIQFLVGSPDSSKNKSTVGTVLRICTGPRQPGPKACESCNEPLGSALALQHCQVAKRVLTRLLLHAPLAGGLRYTVHEMSCKALYLWSSALVAKADGLVEQLRHLLVVGVILALGPRLDEAKVLQLVHCLLWEPLQWKLQSN